MVAADRQKRPVILFASQWDLEYFQRHHPNVSLLDESPAGVNPEVLRQLGYMYDAGGWVLLESAIADLPADLRWLFESGAVTLEQLAGLHAALGITSMADLVAAVRRQMLRTVPGLDASVESAIGDILPSLQRAIRRTPLGRALSLIDPILEALRGAPGVAFVEPAGSLRRGQDMIGDVEIVAPAGDPTAALDAVMNLPDLGRLLHRGPRRLPRDVPAARSSQSHRSRPAAARLPPPLQPSDAPRAHRRGIDLVGDRSF